MAEIKKKNLVLTFNTAAGGEEKLTINTPSESLTAEAISAAMDAIIASKALGEAQLVTDKAEAKYVIQQVESVEFNMK
ncbi:DUF2922 domain-containing protein [Cellulosilyticum ruminicola]|uniref:DUF2922 domain-containing protein n=1 Tax=Cellulosilyticum ruminicola TaxID=425254 RepID=UPI0006D28265|nr:DUF2922 domain-containing protein [Cellulosilyticum ruminicola]